MQERGLYFADKWDAHYETPLAMHDPGEPPLRGQPALGAPRQGHVRLHRAWRSSASCPAGVPGAYRLFANLLAGGKARRMTRAGDADGAGARPRRDGRRAAVPHLARDLRRSCSARWPPRSSLALGADACVRDERARLGRPVRHAGRHRRRTACGRRAAPSDIGRLPARRLPRSLADHRPRRHGHAGAARSPSSRCRARPTRTAWASCSSTSACRSRWWSCRSRSSRASTGCASTPRTSTSSRASTGKTRQLAAFLFLLQRGLSAGHHDLRAGDHALDGARLAAEPDLVAIGARRHRLHGRGRHARGQPDAEAPDGGDAGRDGGGVRRHRPPAAAAICRSGTRVDARAARSAR